MDKAKDIKYVCDYCLKEFITKKGLTYHTENNVCKKHNINSFKCSTCKSSYETAESLLIHKDNMCILNNETNCNRCGRCTKTFSSKRALERHMTRKYMCKKISLEDFKDMKRLCISELSEVSNSEDTENTKDTTKDSENSKVSENEPVNNCFNNISNTRDILIDNSTTTNVNQGNIVNVTYNYNGVPLVHGTFQPIRKDNKQLSFTEIIDPRFLENLGSIIHESLLKYNQSIEHTIKSINCNPEYPIYNNICTDSESLRHGLCKIFDGKQFSRISKEAGIDQLIKAHINLIEQYIRDNADKFNTPKGQLDIKHFKDYVAEINSLNVRGLKSHKKRTLEKSVVGMLMDINDIMSKPEWLTNLQRQYQKYYLELDQIKAELFKDKHLILQQMLSSSSGFGKGYNRNHTNANCANGIISTNSTNNAISAINTNNDAYFEKFINAFEEIYDRSEPSIEYALGCIKAGKKVDWNTVISF